MHMADALLSPTVGLALWGATAVVTVFASRRLQRQADERRVALMGVLGAFVFAAQMINFSIPGTGSSGHLAGGLLLALLLGPHAAFLVMASVLIVQALFFADGGLLALGCNIFNLGFLPAYVVSPLVRRAMGPRANGTRATLAIVAGSVLSLQLGAMAVVLQTVASGISALPLATFAWFMLPIHLAIGLVEGLASAAVVSFVHRMRPDILREAGAHPRPIRGVLAAFAAVALAVGGVAAWYASDAPDGLEWSIERVAGTAGPPAPDGALHAGLERLQRRLAFLPDYAFARHGEQADGTAPAPPAEPAAVADATPTSRLETSVAGIVGATLAMALAALLGLAAAALARRR